MGQHGGGAGGRRGEERTVALALWKRGEDRWEAARVTCEMYVKGGKGLDVEAKKKS